MRVKIENWGPIETCEYDLDKSVVVTYGENNIGKSYAMQLIYLCLKNMILFARHELLLYHKIIYIARENTPVENLVMSFAEDEKLKEKDITENIMQIFSTRLEGEVLNELEDSFRNTFGTYDLIIEKKPVITFEISEDVSCTFYMKEKKILSKIKIKPVYLKKTNSDFHKSRDGKKKLDIYVFDGNHISSAINLIEDKINDIKELFATEILSRIQDVYFLPASRSGIYTGMSSFGPILAELSKNRAYIRGTLQIPSISEPISDYYMELSTITLGHKNNCGDIADEIEREVLKGSVSFDNKKKTILYQSDDTNQLMEMKDVSSMVSEISPITAYLKYIINTNFRLIRRKRAGGENNKPSVMIFIEEPEAHLHPNNQVKLMKIFTKLVKKNVKLFMASHSNYVFNELNNRVLAGNLSKEDYEPVLMEYVDGKSRTYDMQIDDFGVDDDNFQDVTSAILDEREMLISNIVQKMNDQGEK